MATEPRSARKRRVQRPRYSGLLRVRDFHVLGAIALLVMGFALWGVFLACEGDKCGTDGIAERAQKLVGMLPFFPWKGQYGGGESSSSVPFQLYVVQYLLWLLAAFGVIRVGLVNLRRDVRVLLARLRRGHVIVCGLGATGREIAENLRWERGGIVAIALDTDEPNAAALELLKVPILKGDATQFGLLSLAGLRHAHGVIVATGSDAVNIEVALRVEEELAADRARGWPRFWAALTPWRQGGAKQPIFVLPEVRSAWLLELLHTHPTTTLGSETVETRPFDLYASAARQLLGAPSLRRAFPVAPDGAAPGRPHLLIAGLGEMGTQIILQAVQGNFALPGSRLAVTVFDQQGDGAAAGLYARFPGLRDLATIEFEQAVFDADKPETWTEVWDDVETVLQRRDDTLATLAVIVSLKEDKDSLHTALQFRERLDKLSRYGTPVFVRLRHQRELGQFAAKLDGPRGLFDRLIPFGDLIELTQAERLIGQSQDRVARAMHETYLASRGPNARPSAAAVPWTQLAERFKQSNRALADHIPAKLGLVGMRAMPGSGAPAIFTADEVEIMSIAEHRRWLIERLAVGWTLGPRNDIARIHPDIRSWDEIDDGTRDNDRNLVRAIPENLARAGQTVRRERVIVAVGDGIAGAQAELDAAAADEQAIVVFDPAEPASWAFGERAARRGARLWVLWREDSSGPPLAPEISSQATREAMRAAIETAVSAQDLGGVASRPPITVFVSVETTLSI